jgi:hypothetical protein
MIMTPHLRKFALTAHIISSVGWLGAVASFLALAVAGLTSTDAQMARAASLGMELSAWYVIVPLAFGSLLTGLVVALGTPWGLFRHYWVLVKLLLTVPTTLLLLVHTRPIGRLARLATGMTWYAAEAGPLQIQVVRDAAFAAAVLLATTTLSVYKPWGRTRYGRRKLQRERREEPAGAFSSAPSTLPDPDGETTGDGLPAGLGIFLAAVGVLVAAFVVLHLTGGGHGGHAH